MTNCTESCVFINKRNDDYMTWLVEILGPVILGSKPAEILSFPKYDEKSLHKIEEIEKYIGQCRRISYKMFKFRNSSTKIIFYNRNALDEHLREYRNMKFLKNLQYPEQYSLEIYLEHMIDKMKEGVIPHEIGVFLGYPLKDIMGFMGHTSLKLTKVNGWRIYGDPEVSDRKFKEFLDCKERIRKLLEISRPEKILLSI